MGRSGRGGHGGRAGAQGGRRSGTGHVQPELVGPQPAEYWHEDEAQRYHNTSKAARLQAELTHSAAGLGRLPCGPGVVLDLGAGGGLSTVAFQALAAAAREAGGPPFVLAVDASLDMLASAPSLASVAGIRVPPLGPCIREGEEAPAVDVADGVRWRATRSDALRADFSQPLPFRPGVLDGVLSVSAVQWLLDGRPSCSIADGDDLSAPARAVVAAATATAAGAAELVATERPPACVEALQVECREDAAQPEARHPRLQRLFESLRAACVPRARMGLQFYPPKGDHDFGARGLRTEALAAGFTAKVLLDYPHRSSAKKWVMVTSDAEDGKDPGVPRMHTPRPDAHAESEWCALCWPVVAGRCALQHQGVGSGSVRARAEQHHADVALRLARCGRRLLPSAEELEKAAMVRARLEAELHPLHRHLALGLAQLLEEPHVTSPSLASDAKRQRVEKAGGDAASREPAAPPAAPTRTELRAAICARLPGVLQVLHTAPDVKWTIPPPPLAKAVPELTDL